MQDILITPQPLLTSGEPSIVFTASGDVSPITLNVISGVSPISGVSQAGSGITSLSFEGTQGQLFSIIDNLSSGTLFSVSDIAGLPFMEIDASGDIKLAQFGNTVTTYKPIQFSNTGIPTHQEGMLFYDDDNKALAYYNEEADVTLQIGQEQFLRSRNTTGATITNGSIVIITGAHGNVAPTISGAIATSESASQAIGVATHNIEDNSFGYVTTYGIVRDVDTSAFSDGDEIFLSSTSVGSGTPIVPPLPNYKVSIGHVIRSHATAGSMLVQVKSPKLAGGDTKSEYPVYVSGIPFVTASGNGGDSAVLGYDSDFNWDSGNSRLGIGTATPEAKLDITSNTTSDQAPRTILSITGKTGSGTNWSGTDVEAGYTHTDGSADPLVTNITPINNKIYVIVYTISGLSAGRFDFIDFGGVRKNVYNGSNGTYTISLKAENSTDPLELTPRSDFAGTVSIDSITSVEPREAIVSIRTSDGTIANEIRAGVSESQPSNSIYIGYEAGQSASGVGSPSNTAVGRLALSSNVQGGYNTVFGYLNATICTQNSYMTLVGHNMLPYFRSPSTNVYNTAIGTNIAYGTSFTGMSNTLIGNSILSNTATTASNNIAMGLYTMYVATTASNNVSIGNQSLRNHTTGNQNVALGDSAGKYYGSNSNLTVTNNSVFIGYNTKASGDSQTNQIVIGHQAVGNGSNSVTLGNTSITKTVLNGDVGINTISPGAKLHAVAASTTDVVGLFEGAAGQSANVLEVKDSAGNTDFCVDAVGRTNVDFLGVARAVTLQSSYYVEWGGGNNRIRGYSGGVGGGRIELIAGANDGEGGEEIPLVARGDGRGGKGAVIMGQNRDTDYHLEVVGSGSFDGVNISGALTFPIQEDIGAGDQDFMIKYDPSFQAAGGTGAVARISTNMSASGAVTPIHIIAGTSGNVNYNGLKVFENNINIYSDIYPQSSFSSNNPSFGTSTNPFYKGHVSEFIVGNYFSQATLVGDGQNKLGLRNGTNAQTFNLYNTYTSASNYARLQILGDGTDYVIQAANAGAGSQGNTILRAGSATTTPSVIQGAASQSANLTEWRDSAGDVLSYTDNSGVFYRNIRSSGTDTEHVWYGKPFSSNVVQAVWRDFTDGTEYAATGNLRFGMWSNSARTSSTWYQVSANSHRFEITNGLRALLTSAQFDINTHITPYTQNTWDVGTAVDRWRTVYTRNLNVSGVATFLSDGTSNDSILLLNYDTGSSAAPILTFKRDSSSPDNGDYLGQIKFKGENDADQEIVYAKITGKISDVTDATEDGLIETMVKSDGANLIVSRQTGSALKLINGVGLESDGPITAGGSGIPASEPITGASGVVNMMVINSGDYEGITPDANTLYFIVDP